MSGKEDAQVVARFGPAGTSAGAARRFVSDTLAAWSLLGLEEMAILMVSELVGNVILHAGTDLEVELRRSSGVLRVAVRDLSPVLPARKHYSPTSTTGRGLGLVEDLAMRWGVDPTTDGKVVWFELAESSAGATSASVEFGLEGWADLEEWGREPQNPAHRGPASPSGGTAMTGGAVQGRP